MLQFSCELVVTSIQTRPFCTVFKYLAALRYLGCTYRIKSITPCENNKQFLKKLKSSQVEKNAAIWYVRIQPLRYCRVAVISSCTHFLPNYWWDHREKYIFLLSKNKIVGSKCPKKQFIQFWKRLHCPARTHRMSNNDDRMWLLSIQCHLFIQPLDAHRDVVCLLTQ